MPVISKEITEKMSELNIIQNKNLNEIIELCNLTPYKLDDYDYEHFKICTPFFFILDESIVLYYQFIRKKLNGQNNNVLYVMVGISNNSFANNLKILNNNIKKIENKYSEIIFFLYDEKILKIFQKNILQKMNTTNEWIINDMIKEIIAQHYKIIIDYLNNYFKYDSFDLIGVSFSGGVAVYLSKLELKQLKNLILMAPAIFEGFKEIPIEQKIILGWCIQDANKVPYETCGKKLIKELSKFKEKVLILTDLGRPEPNDDITHRLQDSIFDYLSI